MMIRGSVDVVTERDAAGWVYCDKGRGKMNVQAVLNNEIIGESPADIFRADLANAGFGSGNCGFSIQYYREVHPIYLPFVVFKVDGGDVEIPRSSISGYMEFLGALYKRHPPAARQLSILGGGWPTRVDAMSVLNGKLRIGELTASTHQLLLELLARGIAVVPDLDPLAIESSEPLGPAAAAALDAEPVLNVLNALLSDEPLVFASSIIEDIQPGFFQPSAEVGQVWSNETYAIVAPVGDAAVEVDVVRNSHLLPEFNPAGVSRWAANNSIAGLEIALEEQGMVDRIAIPAGSRAVIGPGALHKVRGSAEAKALKVLCAPVRVSHIRIAELSVEHQSQTKPGFRIWVAQPA